MAKKMYYVIDKSKGYKNGKYFVCHESSDKMECHLYIINSTDLFGTGDNMLIVDRDQLRAYK